MASTDLMAGLLKSMSALSTSRHCQRRLRVRPQDLRPTQRFFATFSRRPAQEAREEIRAAPEIDLTVAAQDAPTLARMRIVPASQSYFTSKPSFTDDFLLLSSLVQKYGTLPTIPSEIAPRVAWKKLATYKEMVGHEPISSARYARLVNMLRELNRIHPDLMENDVKQALLRFKRDNQPYNRTARPILIDEFGRAIGIGRRKTSTARAWLVEGDGQIMINGKSLTQFFGRLHDRESAVWALKSMERIDKYNVYAIVSGGGTTGQAEALTLAVSKALLVHEPLLKPALRRAGCVTRDPRKVERKKPGHVKARKMPTWVKR